MIIYAIQLVERDTEGYIRWARVIDGLYSKVTSAVEYAEQIGGEFYILKLECVETIDGKTGNPRSEIKKE